MLNKIPTEAQEQQKVVQWLKMKKITFFAPTNENKYGGVIRSTLIALLGQRRGVQVASRVIASIQKSLASIGFIKGVSDLVIFLPNKILFIEMKRQGVKLKSGKISHTNSKISPEQLAFLDKVNKYPYSKGYVAYGFDEAVDIIEKELV